ncbi:MAG: hypothetical protein NTW18_00025 [Candidatus Omnitrophica bacterium]|nr:hypothetical protein [Candidatus Omnitrophota bacterium]
MKNTDNGSVIDIIAAVILGLLAISCFILQINMLSSQTTQKETVLFNTLQFILTAGFGWFSTRAINRREFEINLKKFALSAFRRITDIDSITGRLRSEINNMLFKRSDSDGYCELNVISAIVEDTRQMIKSSIADWSDVIGEELKTIEKISNLEQEKEKLNIENVGLDIEKKYDKEIKQLDKQIKELNASLPAKLIVAKESSFSSPAIEKQAVFWLRNQHNVEKGLIIQVVSGGHYGDYEISHNLKPKEELNSRKSKEGGLDVIGKNGVLIGRLLNKTPFFYGDFVTTIEKCYGTNELKLEFIEIINTRKGGDSPMLWYTVKVKNLLLPSEIRGSKE